MICLIDNYDSFSYNLYQLIGSVYPAIEVIRNDALTLEELMDRHPKAIVLSPGPGHPKDAGICEEVVARLSGTVPILGVCLGHQAIVEALGGSVGHARQLMHGKASQVRVDSSSRLLQPLAPEFQAGRYHSLSAVEENMPEDLLVTARSDDGEIMAVEHRLHSTFGLQFHPESILTPQGQAIIQAFIDFIPR